MRSIHAQLCATLTRKGHHPHKSKGVFALAIEAMQKGLTVDQATDEAIRKYTTQKGIIK